MILENGFNSREKRSAQAWVFQGKPDFQ